MFLTRKRRQAQDQDQKEQMLIQFYHKQFNLLSDNYLADPTSENIEAAQRTIQFLDSHRYMFRRCWMKSMSLSDMKDHLMTTDRVLAQISVRRGQSNG